MMLLRFRVSATFCRLPARVLMLCALMCTVTTIAILQYMSSLSVFELYPVVANKFDGDVTITALECVGNNVYIGTSHGYGITRISLARFLSFQCNNQLFNIREVR